MMVIIRNFFTRTHEYIHMFRMCNTYYTLNLDDMLKMKR